MPTKTELEDVRMIMLSLLVSRPGFTQLPVLDQDYYEYEGKRIPWRKFGFGSLLEFLQSMPEYFCFSEINGVRSVRAITDKSKHVNSLVERQKKTSKFTRPNRSLYRHPRMLRYRPKIPAEKLNDLVGYVRNHPNGVNINIVLSMLQSQLPYVTLTTYDIQEQLRELGHQLYLDCDTIRPVVRNCSVPRTKISERCMSPLVLEPPVDMSKPSCSNAMYTVPEECPDTMFTDEDGFVRPNSARCSRQPKTDERLISSLKERPNYEEMISYHDNVHHDNQEEMYSIDDNTDSMDLNMTENESNKLSNLISQKMQSRLQQLVQKYPDGIKCSELPDLYMKEFKVPLNYTELGFNSVCTFVSYLPDIFCLKRLDTNDDFIAYNADMILKKQEQDVTRNDDQRTSKSSTRETMSQTKLINIPKSRFEIHDIDNNNTQFPLELPPNVLMKFAPDDVVHCHEISQILVTDLQQSQESYLEVYLVEVFTPSFFWIHLRKNINHFELFMKNLGTFYDEYSERYAIPSLALQRNLNCACIYANVWHRAVIKTVKPDFRVTVLFIDYGTQKTYPPENLFYLTKQFSYLPAQAIPCALYNVKPYGGDRWKKSITDRFIDRINESVLAMTVVSIDSSKNSMLITLTDKSEAKEVCINDWLVEENLAQYGKMVRIKRNIPYIFYEHNIVNTGSFKNEDAVSAADTRKYIDNVRHSNPLVSSGVSPNAMNENFFKSIKILNKVSEKKADNNSKQKDARSFNRLAVLADLVKTRCVDISKLNVDLDATVKVELSHKVEHNDEHFSHKQMKQKSSIKFKERDSDDETNYGVKDFGTFHSLYGGHGEMIPFDWSVIRQIDSSNVSLLRNPFSNPSKMNTSVNKEDETLESSLKVQNRKIHDRIKDLKPCILKLAGEEKEYFLTACNIDCNHEDVSQSVAKLRHRLSVQNDNSTEIIVPRNICEKLRMHANVSRISSCDTIPFPSIENTNIAESQADESNKTHKTIEQEMENKNDDTEYVELSQDVHHSLSKDAFEPNTVRSQHTRNQMYTRCQALLESVKNAKQYWNSSVADNEKAWSSSDPDPSSCHSRSSTDETMHTSDDDQREILSRKNVMSRFNKLRNFATKSASKTSDSSKSNDEIEDLPSNNSTSDESLSYVMYAKLKRMSLVDNSRAFTMLQCVSKMQHECDSSQLDSDDLSDHENSNNDPILDQSKVDDTLVATHNNAEVIPVVPVLNDCDIDSDDSTWDAYIDF